MEQSSNEFRRELYDKLATDIADQEAVIAMMREGKLRTHSRSGNEPLRDTTEADIRHAEAIVTTLKDVIDRYYPEFKE